MEARIYQPARTAMQSGRANTTDWILEFVPAAARTIDSLMGWTSSSDMDQQVKLRFATKNDAIAFAAKHGLPYRVVDPHPRAFKKRAYADNYRWDKVT